MGSGNTKPSPPSSPHQHPHHVDTNKLDGKRTSTGLAEGIFKVSSAIFRVEDCCAEKTQNQRTNPVSEMLDDEDEDFESIIMGAVSNKTIRGILSKELQCGAFASFVKNAYHPGPQLELLNHVMNIEACKRSIQTVDVVHEQFLRLYKHYEAKCTSSAAAPDMKASLLIFKSLQKNLKANRQSEKLIEELSIMEMRRVMRKSQEDILGYLAVPLPEFILSPEYDPYNDRDDDAVARRNTEKATPPFYVRGKDESQSSNQFTAALEASVNKTLMARFRDARLSHFNLNLISPSTTPPARLAEEAAATSSFFILEEQLKQQSPPQQLCGAVALGPAC